MRRTSYGTLKLDVQPAVFWTGGNQYQTRSLPLAGGKSLRLFVSTNNQSESTTNTVINDAYMTPVTEEKWRSSDVQYGVPTTNTVTNAHINAMYDTEETYDAVTAEALLPIMNEAATSSMKSVQQGGNQATSTSTPNYIHLDEPENDFTYTLTLNNESANDMTSFVIIDNLPQVNDHYPFGSTAKTTDGSYEVVDPRNSEFAVRFADKPDVKVEYKQKEATTWTVLDSNKYVVEYSEKTNFEDSDWENSQVSTWNTTSVEYDRSIRIRSQNLSNELTPGTTVRITFNAHVNSSPSKTSIAWNAFGYSAVVGNTTLQATPLKVGVQIAGTWNAGVVKFDEDVPNKGKIYDGTDGVHEATTDSSLIKSATRLEGAVFGLYTPNREDKITDTDLTAAMKKYGLTNGDVPLTLQNGGVEYYLQGIEETKDRSVQWTGSSDNTSPVAAAVFSGLTEDTYMVKELKAPDGYALSDNKVRQITRDDSVDVGFELRSEPPATIPAEEKNSTSDRDSSLMSTFFTDARGYDLPKTGGHGRGIYAVMGTGMLMAAAAGLVMRSLRKKKTS